MATRRKTSRKKKQKNLWADPQVRRGLGLFSLVIAVFLLIAYISYLYTWKLDDHHFHPFSFGFLFGGEEVANRMGRLGSMISFLSFKNFGLASFLFVIVGILTGIRILSPKKHFSLKIFGFYFFWGILLLCVALSFFTLHEASGFPFGGVLGDQVVYWSRSLIGFVGTGLVLLFFTIIYLGVLFDMNLDDFFESIAKMFKVKKPSLNIFGNFSNLFPKDMGKSRATNSTKAKTKSSTAKTNARSRGYQNDAPLETESAQITFDFPTPSGNKKKPKRVVKTKGIGATSDEKDFIIDYDPPGPQEALNKEEPRIGAKKEVDVTIEKGDYDPTADLSQYKKPPVELLEYYGNDQIDIDRAELERNKERIVETLSNYNIEIERITATPGATITLYEIVPAPGVRISKIKGLVDDIALSLSALGIRIIAPIPGKGTIGIEIPNAKKKIVSLRALVESEQFQNTRMDLPVAIGTGIRNRTFVADLAKFPHLLMAGATGQGKSVCINTLLVSLLYKKHPGELKFIMIDPKKVELSIFEKIERHFLACLPDEEEAIVTDTQKVISTLNALCIEMDNRYDLLKAAHVRNIKEYNAKFIKRKLNPNEGHRFLPYFVLVIDEFADLMMTAGKEVETPLTRLAQLARAIGIHLIIATQRPTVNIITGTIKANFPVRIAFRVTSKVDSRTIIDGGGAEQLIGRGDMILIQGADSYRLQGALVDTPEVERIADHIADQQSYGGAFELPEYNAGGDSKGGKDAKPMKRDKLFNDAARLIVRAQSGSTSLIQRKMSLGYNRSGRIMDQLEQAGIVGANQGSKPREVFVYDETELEELLARLGSK